MLSRYKEQRNMPEVEVTDPPPKEKLAGKYTDRAALKAGFIELSKKLELDDLSEDAIDTVFKEDKALEKAYLARAKVLSSRKVEAATKPVEKPVETTNAPANDPLAIGAVDDDPDVDGILAKAGLKADDLVKSWEAGEKLTDEQYAALKKVGYPRKIADTLIRGQYAAAALNVQVKQTIRAEAASAVGGEEALKNLNLWAEANIPKPRMDTFREMVKANPRAYPEVVRLIQAEHAKELGAGNAQPLVTGGVSTNLNGAPKTFAEWNAVRRRAEMGDPAAIELLRKTDITKLA
jgi:hypothetical protein